MGLLLESYRYDHRGLRTRRSGPEGVVRYVYDDTALLLETDAFGNRNLRRELGASENPFAFTGHHLDRPTGLYYAQQRYYDPELGLFLTEDPVEGGNPLFPPRAHRYLYAYSNPLVYVDPDGRIEVLREAQEDLRRIREKVSEEVESEDETFLAAAKLAGLSLLDKGLGLVNAGTNLTISTFAPDTELGRQAQEEIEQAVEEVADSGRDLAEQVVEDPIGFATTVSEAPQDFMLGGLKTGVLAIGASDPQVRAENQAVVLEVGLEVLAGTAVFSRGRKTVEVIDEIADA